MVVAGLSDGRVWGANMRTEQRADVASPSGAPITALAVGGGRIAWGDEAGGAGVAEIPSALA